MKLYAFTYIFFSEASRWCSSSSSEAKRPMHIPFCCNKHFLLITHAVVWALGKCQPEILGVTFSRLKKKKQVDVNILLNSIVTTCRLHPKLSAERQVVEDGCERFCINKLDLILNEEGNFFVFCVEFCILSCVVSSMPEEAMQWRVIPHPPDSASPQCWGKQKKSSNAVN